MSTMLWVDTSSGAPRIRRAATSPMASNIGACIRPAVANDHTQMERSLVLNWLASLAAASPSDGATWDVSAFALANDHNNVERVCGSNLSSDARAADESAPYSCEWDSYEYPTFAAPFAVPARCRGENSGAACTVSAMRRSELREML
eukprot:320295-Pleurochrysis_carterae.AAC.3